MSRIGNSLTVKMGVPQTTSLMLPRNWSANPKGDLSESEKKNPARVSVCKEDLTSVSTYTCTVTLVELSADVKD